MTGMFYKGGRLYYTLAGQSSLYWRWFTPDSGTVGADRFTYMTSTFFAGAGGVFTGDGSLYAVRQSSGNLEKMAWPTDPSAPRSPPRSAARAWTGSTGAARRSSSARDLTRHSDGPAGIGRAIAFSRPGRVASGTLVVPGARVAPGRSAQTVVGACSRAQTRIRSRTEITPATSRPSSTTRCRKPPRAMAAAASSTVQSGPA